MCKSMLWHIATNLSTTRLGIEQSLINYRAFYSRVFRENHVASSKNFILRVPEVEDAMQLSSWPRLQILRSD